MKDIVASTKTKAVLEGFGAPLGSFSGELEKAGDHDWIKVTLTEGIAYQFFLSFSDIGATYGDAVLTLRDSTGAIVDTNDNGGISWNNAILPFAPAAGKGGTYYLDVGEVGGDDRGSYTLTSWVSGTGILLSNGNDDYTGLADDERIIAGAGADHIDIGAAKHALGEQGNDIIVGNGLTNSIFGGLGSDWLEGNAGNDFLHGDAGNDEIFGGDDDDQIVGGLGDDLIDGEDGEDVIVGGLGKDVLRGGDGFDGSDTFVYLSLADSSRKARDVIVDFASFDSLPGNDLINLIGIDARKGGGANDDFRFIGTKQFHDRPGELRYQVNAKQDLTLIQGDVNGDGRADFVIELVGQVHLTGDSFLF